MKEYLLFVDTETSGLPVDWEKPYHVAGNWPYIVQLAWIIYTREGEEVKRENHFIKANDYSISHISREIHGISEAFLQEHGSERKEVMQCIYNDLLHYQPLVVGHFMQLDYHMLGLGFYRAGLENPLKALPTFCTMVLTKDFWQLPGHKYLRLNELYFRLFNKNMPKQHDALEDAEATALCFFELKRRRDITDEIILTQKNVYDSSADAVPERISPRKYLLPLLVLLLLLLILIFWLI